MKIKIKRYCKHRSPEPNVDVEYEIDVLVVLILFELLLFWEIKF
jgi:hypothetical protein